MNSRSFIVPFLWHIGFHAIWILVGALVYIGIIVFLPPVALYSTFALGFIWVIFPDSLFVVVLLGTFFFLVTGLISGLIISFLKPRHLQGASVITLIITLVIAGIASAGALATWHPGPESDIPAEEPIAQDEQELLEAARAQGRSLKLIYQFRDPKTIPYVENAPFIAPLMLLEPEFEELNHKLRVKGFVYCNFPEEIWEIFRRAEIGHIPVAWSESTQRDGHRVVIMANLETDAFRTALVPDAWRRGRLKEMEQIGQSEEPEFLLIDDKLSY